jgi:SpoIID/LytB domain protein
VTRRLLPLLLSAAVAVALVPAAPATAARNFTFFGSGYGHGLGMSQWGANGLARMGWSEERIIEHFYRGTEVARTHTLPPNIRIEILAGVKTVHVKAQSGRVELWLGEPGGRRIDAIPGGKTWTIGSKGTSFVIRDGAGHLVGGRRWGGPNRPVVATYQDTGARAFVREADAISGRGFEYNRGRIEFGLYACSGGCAVRAVVPLRFEEYLYGLAEVPTSWPVEALRAQAIAARSYAAATIRSQGGLRAGCGCHLTDGAGDQVYKGYSHEGAAGGSRWVAAVRDTKAKAALYRGDVIQAFYAASDGGHSENVEDVWHGGNDAYSIPWLRGVCDPGESTAGNPYTNWKVAFSADGLASRLGLGIGRIRDFGSIRRGRSGRIVEAVVIGADGRRRVDGSDLRSRLGLRDTRVWIDSNRNIVDGPIRERYDALGCKPGLPTSKQLMLDDGRQQLFRTGGIFRNERAGLTIWLRGAIFDEYDDVGTGRGVLGLPTTDVVDLAGGTSRRAVSCNDCSRMNFERGRIYFDRNVGAHAIWGRVLTAYLDGGGPGGSLGFPTSRVRRADGGQRARFEHGTIVCPRGGTCSVTAS